MGFFQSASKIILIVLNTLFFLVGAVILGVGIWIKVDKSNLFSILRKINLSGAADTANSSSTSMLNIIAIVLIIVGVFTFVTGFLGCCGALRESTCLLYMYSALVAIVIIVEIAIGIYAGVKQHAAKDGISKALSTSLEKEFISLLKNTTSPNIFSLAFSGLMIEMNCCGVNNITDFQQFHTWNNGTKQINPVGCCQFKSNQKPSLSPGSKFDYNEIKKALVDKICPYNPNPKPNSINTDGCVNSFIELMKKNLAIVIGCCVGLGLFEILCIVFACCVAKRNDDKIY